MGVDATVLLRKMRRGAGGRAALPDATAIGLTLARQVEERLRPLLRCRPAVTARDCGVIRLPAGGPAGPVMAATLRFEGADRLCLVTLDAALVWHLVDVTLGGEPEDAAPVPEGRAFGGIEMALCRLHLEALAAAVGAALGGMLGGPLARPPAVADQRAGLDELAVAPEGSEVLSVALEVAVGDGRSGGIGVALPLATLDALRAAAARAVAPAADRPNDLWRDAMRRAAATAQVRLEAVIHRERMTLSAVAGLEPGQFIEIDPDAPGRVALTLDQPGGRAAVIAQAQLGVYQGRKVLRVRGEPDPRLAGHVRAALGPAGLPAPAAQRRLPAPAEEEAEAEPAR